MTVRTDQLLLRKNYNVTEKSYMLRDKSFLVLLRLQVKSMLSFYFSFSKKRFFFNQSTQRFNCFNRFIQTNIYFSAVNRQAFFFSGQNKQLLFSYKSARPLNTNAFFNTSLFTQHRTFWDFYGNQLFYTLLKYHRLFITPILGLSSRYTRFSRLLKTHKSFSTFHSVFSGIRKLSGIEIGLQSAFFRKYRRLKFLTADNKRARFLVFDDLNKIIFLLTRNFQDITLFNKRFLLFYGHKIIFRDNVFSNVFTEKKTLRPFLQKRQIEFTWIFITDVTVFSYKRRRLFFFSGKTYILQITDYISFLLLNKNFHDFYQIVKFILYFLFNSGFWYYNLLSLVFNVGFVTFFLMRKCFFSMFDSPSALICVNFLYNAIVTCKSSVLIVLW